MSATDANHISIDKETIKTAQKVSKQVADFLHSIINNPRKLDQLKLMLIGMEKVKHLDKRTQDRFFGYYAEAPIEVVAPIFRDYALLDMVDITAFICKLPTSRKKIKSRKRDAFWDFTIKVATLMTIFEFGSTLLGDVKDFLIPSELSTQEQKQIEPLRSSTKVTETSSRILGTLSLEELDEIESQILRASPND